MIKHKQFLFTLVIIVIASIAPSGWFSAKAVEEQLPPPIDEQTIILGAGGAGFKQGWNYFTVGFDGCSVKTILDELQADGGAVLEATTLFVNTGKREQPQWQPYSLINPEAAASNLAPEQLLAFYANTKFYFNLEKDACTHIDAARQEQIEQVRGSTAAKQENSLVEKIGSLPIDLWGRLMDLLTETKIEKGDNEKGQFEKLNVLGKSVLGDVGVTGDVMIGLLHIEGLEEAGGASLQTLSGPLKLQKQALGNIEIFGGKLVLDKKGNLVISEGVIRGNENFRGVIQVKSGIAEVRVTKDWQEVPVAVNLTPSYNTTIWVENISEKGFTIKIGTAPGKEEHIYWLAVW